MKNSEKQKTPVVNMYSVCDKVAGRFFPPFLSESDQTANRSFRSMCQNPESTFAQNPEDYDLFLLADFDPNDGQIDVLDSPLRISSAVDFANAQINH